jgi:hypothetical protein
MLIIKCSIFESEGIFWEREIEGNHSREQKELFEELAEIQS